MLTRTCTSFFHRHLKLTLTLNLKKLNVCLNPSVVQRYEYNTNAFTGYYFPFATGRIIPALHHSLALTEEISSAT